MNGKSKREMENGKKIKRILREHLIENPEPEFVKIVDIEFIYNLMGFNWEKWFPQKSIDIELDDKRMNVVQIIDENLDELNLLERVEKNVILKILKKYFFNQKKAAQELGISARALNYKIKKYGINYENWRRVN